MRGSDSRERGNKIMAKVVSAILLSDRKHNLMGQVMLHLSLEPSQKISVAIHCDALSNDPEIAIQMLIRERGSIPALCPVFSSYHIFPRQLNAPWRGQMKSDRAPAARNSQGPYVNPKIPSSFA
jgi:hypothetical protein